MNVLKICGLLCAAIATVLFVGFFGSALWGKLRLSQSVVANAALLELGDPVNSGPAGMRSQIVRVRIAYSFTDVEGNPVEGHHEEWLLWDAQGRRDVQMIQDQGRVKIKYDPSDPTRALLASQWDYAGEAILFAMVAFACAFGWMIYILFEMWEAKRLK